MFYLISLLSVIVLSLILFIKGMYMPALLLYFVVVAVLIERGPKHGDPWDGF